MNIYCETNSYKSHKFMPIQKKSGDYNDCFVLENSDTLNSRHFSDLHLLLMYATDNRPRVP